MARCTSVQSDRHVCDFMPMHYSAWRGMPRRYSQMTEVAYLHDLIAAEVHHLRGVSSPSRPNDFPCESFGACSRGQASDNRGKPPRWNGLRRLRRRTTFRRAYAVVHNGPYEYSGAGRASDYVMQNDRNQAGTLSTHGQFLHYPTISDPKFHGTITALRRRFETAGRWRAGLPDYGTRLRRARLGLLVALTPILMLFVSFTSAYVVRQGLRRWTRAHNNLTRDWDSRGRFPDWLLLNTFVLLSAA